MIELYFLVLSIFIFIPSALTLILATLALRGSESVDLVKLAFVYVVVAVSASYIITSVIYAMYY